MIHADNFKNICLKIKNLQLLSLRYTNICTYSYNQKYLQFFYAFHYNVKNCSYFKSIFFCFLYEKKFKIIKIVIVIISPRLVVVSTHFIHFYLHNRHIGISKYWVLVAAHPRRTCALTFHSSAAFALAILSKLILETD